jgi:Ner family transcriptional regulator
MDQQGWHRADIRAAVEKKGKTLTQLALDHGLNESACRRALCGRNIPGEKTIAAFIGVAVWELWPGRWRSPVRKGGEPTRIDNRFHKKSRRSAGQSHCQKAKAA